MLIMGEKEPVYSIYGEASEYSEATEVREQERVKSDALEAFRDIGIRFPVASKGEFLKAIRKDRPTACHYRGRTLTLRELVGSLRDSDFPIKSPAEAAVMLAAACPIRIESPESAPDPRPF